MRRRTAAALVALAGCAQSHRPIAVDAPHAMAGAAALHANRDEQATGAASIVRSELWIGKMRGRGDALCDQHAPPPADVVIDRVLLALDSDTAGGLSGSIQFGEGVVPSDPGDAPFQVPVHGGLPPSFFDRSSLFSFWSCSVEGPARGARYSLHEVVRTESRLRFEVQPNEIWESFCAHDARPCRSESFCAEIPATCSCEGRDPACVETPIARVPIDLAITATTLEGELSFGSMLELRLERVP